MLGLNPKYKPEQRSMESRDFEMAAAGQHLRRRGGQAVRRDGAQHNAAQDARCIVVVLRSTPKVPLKSGQRAWLQQRRHTPLQGTMCWPSPASPACILRACLPQRTARVLGHAKHGLRTLTEFFTKDQPLTSHT